MHFTKALPILAAITPVILAEIDLDNDDIPTQCTQVCDPLLNLVRQCNVDDDAVGGDRNEDLLERQCVCTNNSFDVANVAALCASCMTQNVRERDDLEDINDLMLACNFQSTSFAASATTIVQGVTVSATRPTDINQLTTTVGSEPTSGSNNNNNNNNNNNDDGNGAGALAPGMVVSVAGAALACAMLLH
ncbi:hypothetical protein jhhlp_004777 [Lomentospora prolificans]|uniref:Protein CAP22 n=1 Tax=Lomentospora prolificans TaxID=41688 RepID=A0A2N3N8J2_9PEZI|nr:hypothetical protein jhhlp_004777 [Lomentospora prolificans]